MASLIQSHWVHCHRLVDSIVRTPRVFAVTLRQLHVTPAYRTDGVYRDLTNMRVRTPWVEALRKQRADGIDPTKKSDTPATPANRDLRPKRMSDSFHRVVRTYQLSKNATELIDVEIGDSFGARPMASGQLPQF